MFDINRQTDISTLFADDLQRGLQAQQSQPQPFNLTLVTNANPDSPSVVARSRPARGMLTEEHALDLQWPDGVNSLSHVALPFPPGDPVYGRASEHGYTLGSLELRGERTLLSVPVEQLMRLRYNPFYPYLERRAVEFVIGETAPVE